jgi:exodeoxyribonuclease VII small subunit
VSDETTPAPGAGEPPTFERALAALDEVVRRLEEGDVGLEEAVALFEEGQRHLALCRERLAAAERRIEELTADELPRDAAAPPEGEPPF